MRHGVAKRRECRGFTLIELAVVASIVALLAAALLSRAVFYQEQAEKAAVDQTVGIIRSALHLQIAGFLVKGKNAEIATLADQNPMDWLAEKPGNYVGEYYAPKPGMVASGKWYFDLQSRNLVYLAHSHEHLKTAAGEGNKLRYRAKVVGSLNSATATGSSPANGNAIEGVILEPVVSYTWF